MTTTDQITLFFAQNLLRPEDPRGWEKFLKCEWARNSRKNPLIKEGARRCAKAYREKNPDRVRQSNAASYQKNREENIERSVRWGRLNPEKRRVRERRYRSPYIIARRARDPGFRILINLRCRIKEAVKNIGKGARTRALLGMEIPEFKIYLQGQFLPGMTWENYGPVWHIDHIRPCASFDLTDLAQQRECFNWSNCQPLFAEANLRKGAHYVST